MKQQVFYIHGGHCYGTYEEFLHDLTNHRIRDIHNEPKDRWTKQLRSDLGEGYEVFTPDMPNKQNAQYEEWKIWFERHYEHAQEHPILIGLSLGAIFLAKYLNEEVLTAEPKAVFLLAAPFEVKELRQRDTDVSFDFDTENLAKLKAFGSELHFLHSKDDFVVPYEHALKYKEALPEAELITFEDKNHFLVEELPELVELIKSL